jgi:outer membrane protein assembly factor BamB
VSPSHRGTRLLPRLALGAVVLVLGVVAALALFGGNGDVSHPDVNFVPTTEAPSDTTTGHPGKHPADDGFEWPVYGYRKSRTHELPLNVTPHPPYRQAWALRGKVLLEFSPVLCRRKIYLLKNNGALYAISRLTGRVSWKRHLGTLAAASPACSHGSVYVVLLSHKRGSANTGRVVALHARTGSVRWARTLPSRAEGSPLLDRGRLYIGTEDGTVYALRAGNGHIRWTAKAAGAVKGAIALDAGKLYFGDYGGQVHAIRRSNGSKVWSVSPSSGPLGLGDGNFYSSAAVQYGRVYIGSTNGDVYSFSSVSGKLAWRKHTGGFVYASPAVGQPKGGRPTVYIGSYDGHFYALDARSGATRWVRSLGSKISGAATIIGDLVWVSDLGSRTTWALGVRTGRTAWKTHRGGFNPAISDGRRIYFTGLTSMFALDPVGHPFDPSAKAKAAAAAAARQHALDKRVARRVRAERRARERRKRAIGRRVARRRAAERRRAARGR